MHPDLGGLPEGQVSMTPTHLGNHLGRGRERFMYRLPRPYSSLTVQEYAPWRRPVNDGGAQTIHKGT